MQGFSTNYQFKKAPNNIKANPQHTYVPGDKTFTLVTEINNLSMHGTYTIWVLNI